MALAKSAEKKPEEGNGKKSPPEFEVLVKVDGEYVNVGALWAVDLKSNGPAPRRGYSMRLKTAKFPKDFDGNCLVAPVRR